ncbi:uncharacterized protein CMU_004590 [Cryptosporidium muris RN66]|uniref:SART-1 family protein n=1 Tax=Cryptosporidium muris (strain RN66) TaxID=441375 RepID=B6AK63_CRYMR|nr:uncharacterized protein CMU_004590 [Cryptosporidium muris RN66]EEA08604.1 hypothetical protein, conserved [Cryptosporidium muris RN66]|eukprot:XP_002142953.1 hypothetical protein [Cryptosporidium muris RN66]
MKRKKEGDHLIRLDSDDEDYIYKHEHKYKYSKDHNNEEELGLKLDKNRYDKTQINKYIEEKFPIFIPEDCSVLDEEINDIQLNLNNLQNEMDKKKVEYNEIEVTEVVNKQNINFKNIKKLKTNIQDIKLRLRNKDIYDYETESSTRLNIEDVDYKVDDDELFYSKLSISKVKTPIINLDNEKELGMNIKMENTNDKLIKDEGMEIYDNLSSGIIISTEDEICRLISNKNNIRNNNDVSKKDIILTNSSITDNSNVNVELFKKSEEIDNISNYSNNDLFVEKPLDFGIASALELFKQRGETFSNPINNKQDSLRDIVLWHMDENGNILTQKEAFRQLCWKFHGKKSGKNKIEKMIRRSIRNA